MAKVEIADVDVTFSVNGEEVAALRDVSLTINPGDRIVVRGPSGSGKSSLLMVLAGLLVPDAGSVVIDDAEDVVALDADQRASYRRSTVALLMQAFDLVEGLTVGENLQIASDLVPERVDPAWTDSVADELGVTTLFDRFAHELSGGQRQRAALTRCLSLRAPLVLLDEPTSAVDPDNARRVMGLLDRLDPETTVIGVTHDPAFDLADSRNFVLTDGHLG